MMLFNCALLLVVAGSSIAEAHKFLKAKDVARVFKEFQTLSGETKAVNSAEMNDCFVTIGLVGGESKDVLLEDNEKCGISNEKKCYTGVCSYSDDIKKCKKEAIARNLTLTYVFRTETCGLACYKDLITSEAQEISAFYWNKDKDNSKCDCDDNDEECLFCQEGECKAQQQTR